MKEIPKPIAGEFAPYASMYIDLLPNDNQVLSHLQANLQVMQEFILTFPPEKLTYRWAEGEWTIKEILVHIIDDERIYCYRALRFARNDKTELPGFEQDDYVTYSGANERTLADILDEYRAVRAATLTFFNSLEDNALTRSGVANGHVMSVRAAAYHLAGHELHHLNSIKENYSR
jgi:uncharacterized damage-inducible protein DinB